MALGGLVIQRLATAKQQPEIRRALEQAEEVFRCIARFIDAQHATLIDLGQQPLHALQHALGASLEEDQRQFRILATQGHDQAMQVQRLVTVDQMMKTAGDVQQHGFHRNAFRQFKKQRRQLFFALGHYGGGEQRLLVVEMAVDRQLRHPGLGCDGIHAGIGITLTQKQRFRRVENGLALDQILGSAWAIGC
ncbi:hypothetical protein D3C87_1245040 [compost metagenome]